MINFAGYDLRHLEIRVQKGITMSHYSVLNIKLHIKIGTVSSLNGVSIHVQ